MPADYKYTHISLGSLKALKMAQSRYLDLYREFAKSGVIDPSVLERMRVLRILLGKAANSPVGDTNDIQLLDELLGDNMGEIYDK
jgi:hypothetical protein